MGKYKGIMFKGEHIPKIMSGRKTQTRRVVRSELLNGFDFCKHYARGRSGNFSSEKKMYR